MKSCPTCNVVKEDEEFSKRTKAKDGLQGKCKSCARIYKRAWHYGMSDEVFRNMLIECNYSCTICKTPTRSLVVDHCHTTGEVRGLLCTACNVGLGHFRDSLEILTNAVSYLSISEVGK